jgi:hypothetical protein
MRFYKDQGICTQCNKEFGYWYNIDLWWFRSLFRKRRWPEPKWCSGCRIDSAEDAREARQKWYGGKDDRNGTVDEA